MSNPVIIASIRKNARERVRIALDSYQGTDLVDIRVTVELNEATGIQTPTKKGVSIRLTMLGELIAALQEAETTARALGLIGGDS